MEAVKLLSEGKDISVWFPTGYGKSICYQLLPFVFDVQLGRTNAPLVDRSVVLVISPFMSYGTRISLSVSFICIFIELYNCFMACFTVECTIATDTPIYNQYQAVFFTHCYISEKSAWGRGYNHYSIGMEGTSNPRRWKLSFPCLWLLLPWE